MVSPFQRIRGGAVALAAVFAISVFAFRFVGGYDWLEAVWLVVITISTVGYSEHTDSPPAMQFVTMAVILFGVTAAAYTFSGFIQMMLMGEVDRALGRLKMSKDLNQLENHVIICGFGHLGQDLASQLSQRDLPFVVIDFTSEKVVEASESGYLAIFGDASSEKLLEEVRIGQARALASALPTDADNVFITLTARNLNPQIQIIAKSERESSCRKLRQAGANKIVMPYRIGAQQMERMITRPSTADLVELFAEVSHLEMELDEFKVPTGSGLVGSTLADSKIKDQFNLLVVGISDEQGQFRFNPRPHEIIHSHDVLLVIGNVDDINRMKESHRVRPHG